MSNLVENIEKSRNGDRQAFGVLVQQHAGSVTGVAFSVCGDFAKSEDIGQEAFIEAWKSLDSLNEPEKFLAWVCTIARRRAIDHLRRSKETGSIDQMKNEPHDKTGSTPESDMAAQQQQELVWSVVESLPETYRETMILFYRGEQSTRDVAIATDESEATVRQRLKRGREMIRAEITDSLRAALMETAPKAAFSAAVVAALPSVAIAGGATGATGAVAAVTKSSASGTVGAGSAAAAFGVSGAVIGSLVGLLGGLLGVACGFLGAWNSWRQCEYKSQQQLIVRMSIIFLVQLAIFLLLLTGLIVARLNGMLQNGGLYITCLVLLIAGSQLFAGIWIWQGLKAFKRVSDHARASGESKLVGAPQETSE